MPSLSYKMTEKLFFHTVKSIMGDSRAAFVDYVFSMASKRKLEVPSARWQSGYEYEEVENGETTLVRICPKGGRHESLILYLTGDGLFQPPALADFELCGDLANHTGRDVWLLSYPLIPDASPAEILESVLQVYEEAAARYPSGRIAVMGLSSGCQLAMGLCIRLLSQGRSGILPACLLLQSPPMRIPPSEEQMERMTAAEARDCVFPADYYRWLSAIADFRGCEFLLRPLEESLAGFPPLYVFYGEYETAAAYIPELEEKCAADGAALTLETGAGMMHNWCLLGKTPEGTAIRKHFCEILKREATF